MIRATRTNPLANAAARRLPARAWRRILGAVLGVALAAPAVAAIPAAERQVLINLYNSTGGGGWTSKTNWCSGTCPATGTPTFAPAGSECNWFGVTCDDTQSHVVAVTLSNNHLVGTLPAIAGLSSLHYFSAASNSLSGALPALGALTDLQTFQVSANAFSGSIPALAGLAQLGEFAAQDNQLSGSLPSLSGLTGLYSFIVSGNQLSGTIPSLSGLATLREFDVGGNQLTGAIPAVSGLPNLLRLSVDHNRLTGSIPALPPALVTLQAGYNSLSGAVPAAPSSLYTPVAFAPSSLCPNALSTSASANDGGWNQATGFSPWWTTPSATNRCDGLFVASFD